MRGDSSQCPALVPDPIPNPQIRPQSVPVCPSLPLNPQFPTPNPSPSPQFPTPNPQYLSRLLSLSLSIHSSRFLGRRQELGTTLQGEGVSEPPKLLPEPPDLPEPLTWYPQGCHLSGSGSAAPGGQRGTQDLGGNPKTRGWDRRGLRVTSPQVRAPSPAAPGHCHQLWGQGR